MQLVLPLVVIAGLGYVTTRWRYVSESAIEGMTQFVVAIAVPALVFRSMVQADLGKLFDNLAALTLAFFLGALAVFLLALVSAHYVFRSAKAEQSGLGLAAARSNVLLLGIPAVTLVLGTNLNTPLVILVGLHGMVMALLATLVLHLRARNTADLPSALGQALVEQAKNPIFIALVAGLVYGGLDLSIPGSLDLFLQLMGSTAAPCAIFVLGGALTRFPPNKPFGPPLGVALLKLAVHPAITWVLAAKVFSLPGSWVWVAVMLATMPSAFDPEITGRTAKGEVPRTAVLVTTVLAAVRITVLVELIRRA